MMLAIMIIVFVVIVILALVSLSWDKDSFIKLYNFTLHYVLPFLTIMTTLKILLKVKTKSLKILEH